VRVLGDFAYGAPRNLRGVLSDSELIEGDIQSYERVANAMRGCEIVFPSGVRCSLVLARPRSSHPHRHRRHGDADRHSGVATRA
jgi:hypothetical protein